ncbi:MAG: tetratricopeptide repeat protein [Ktedonobacteraceae bacterium]|nr:tetratricopeptide repeat protein [Chloroflexota bacterium]
MGDLTQARVYALRSCDQKPENAEHGCLLTWLKMCQDGPEQATANYLKDLAAFDPQVDAAYLCRGIALWLQEEYEAALLELEQLSALEPLSKEAYFWIGVVYASLGRDQEAIDALKHALELGLFPQLLTPLTWLKETRPDFYEQYARPLLAQ